MTKKENDRFEINEFFMAKPDEDRYFTGIIKRLKDDRGYSFVFSRIDMPDGILCASAPEQNELGENLDKICVMILDNGLHKRSGVTTKIFDADFFLN